MARRPDDRNDRDNRWAYSSSGVLWPSSQPYRAISSYSSVPCESSSSSSSSSALPSSQPAKTADKDYPDEVMHGIPLPAMIVPPVILLFAILALCMFLKHRRRRHREGDSIENPNSSAVEIAQTGGQDVREHRSSARPDLRQTQFRAEDVTPAPVIISDRNDNYLTGLDTSSQGSQSRPASYVEPEGHDIRRSIGGTFLDPPPPYKVNGNDPPPAAYEYEDSPAYDVEHVRSPFADPELLEHEDGEDEEYGVADGMRQHEDPFADPVSPVSPVDDAGERWRLGRSNG